MIRLCKRFDVEIVSTAFVIELFDLGGAAKIKNDYNIETFSLLEFPGH